MANDFIRASELCIPSVFVKRAKELQRRRELLVRPDDGPTVGRDFPLDEGKCLPALFVIAEEAGRAFEAHLLEFVE
jgi:hypothetical protein